VIQLQSIALAPFPAAESLNPRFQPGHAKLRLTVDAEPMLDVPDQALHARLVAAFPGLARHHCQVQDAGSRRDPRARGVVLVDGETTANQAHLLEHLLLEMLSFLDRVPRLSGVTCAYTSPPERSDVFVECADGESGGLAARVAVDAVNAALAGEPLSPLYPDVLRCARLLRRHADHPWPAARLARAARIPRARAEAALEALAHAAFVERESYALNFSGEPHYRFVGAGVTGPPRVRPREPSPSRR
jgi:hypothetical protein